MPRIVITIPGAHPQTHRTSLEQKVVTFGRGDTNDIVISQSSVSNNHAELRLKDGVFTLVDCGSTNGIKHKDEKQQEICMSHGIYVKLGDVFLEFILSKEELAQLSDECQTTKTLVSAAVPRVRLHPKVDEESTREIPLPVPITKTSSKRAGAGGLIFTLLLAIGALYAGLEIRHQKDTGNTLTSGIFNQLKSAVYSQLEEAQSRIETMTIERLVKTAAEAESETSTEETPAVIEASFPE